MPEIANVRRVIKERNSQLEKWYASGDIDAVAGVFANDCWQMPPHADPLVGRNALREWWKRAVTWGKWEFALDLQDVVVNCPIAVERGRYTVRFTANSGAPRGLVSFQDKGNYVVLWRMEADKEWRIVWDAPVSGVPLPAAS